MVYNTIFVLLKKKLVQKCFKAQNMCFGKIKGMFRIVVAVTVQSVFRLEMHQNNFFYFFKIIFDINTSKRSKNIKTNSFYAKKNLNFKGTRCTKHALNVKSNRIHSNQYQN